MVWVTRAGDKITVSTQPEKHKLVFVYLTPAVNLRSIKNGVGTFRAVRCKILDFLEAR